MSLVNDDGSPIVSAEEVTDAGLIVPVGTKEKHAKTIMDWKMIRRAVRSLLKEGARVHLVCNECDKTMAPLETEMALECSCTKWRIRK